MKKVLFASTALVLSAGFAAAEVEVGGDGRMGVIKPFGSDDLEFTSRIRISFSASGQTDGGLEFGGSVRADNYEDDQATNGDEGTVFVSGAFGKLSMGDVDGAAKAAVGHVSGVGLTGLGDLNEITYIANVGPDTPGALYEYSTGDLSFYLSHDNPTGDNAYAVGVAYGMGNYTVALGYEDSEAAGFDHIVLGASAGFGDATVKAVYGMADTGDEDQWALSLDYVVGATTVTAFYKDGFDDSQDYGIGASYDLGGGASLKAGYAHDESADDEAYDFGISMKF